MRVVSRRFVPKPVIPFWEANLFVPRNKWLEQATSTLGTHCFPMTHLIATGSRTDLASRGHTPDAWCRSSSWFRDGSYRSRSCPSASRTCSYPTADGRFHHWLGSSLRAMAENGYEN